MSRSPNKSLKTDDILYMGGVGEHIHGLNMCYFVTICKKCQIACLGSRVTAHIDNPIGTGGQYGSDNILMNS